MSRKLSILIIFVSLLLLAVTVQRSFAQEASPSATASSLHQQFVNVRETALTEKASKEANLRNKIVNRLTNLKLKVCQQHEKNIQNRSNDMAKRAQNQIDRFNKIAIAVETFYANQMIPSNKIVANYATLTADIDAKKVAVVTLSQTVATDAASFNCSSDDPVGNVTQFKTDMQALIQGVKDYRQSVRTLIIAVKVLVVTVPANTATSSAIENTEKTNQGTENVQTGQ